MKASIIAVYLRLKPLFEKLSSGDNLVPASHVISSIDEVLQINPEELFVEFTEKETYLISNIRDYLGNYWSSIPKEAYTLLSELAVALYKSLGYIKSV